MALVLAGANDSACEGIELINLIKKRLSKKQLSDIASLFQATNAPKKHQVCEPSEGDYKDSET